MKEAIFLLLCIASICSKTYAQHEGCKIILSGKITDSSSLQPVAHAKISVSNQLNVLSNHLGVFEIKNLCKETINLVVSHIAYDSHRISFDLENDTSITLSINKKSTNLETVYIDQYRNNDQSLSIHRLKNDSYEENKGKTLAELLQNISGVNILKTGSNIAKPVINGLFGNRLIILNNGVRHESQQWGMDHAPEIDPFATSDIAIIKNADAVRYGPDALGGIIRLDPKAINMEKKFTGNISTVLNTNGKSGLLNTQFEGTSHNFSYRLGLTGIKSGNIKTPDYYLGNTGKTELNSNLLLNYKKGKNSYSAYFSNFNTTLGIFEGAHIGSKDDILIRIQHGRPFENYQFTYDIDAPKQHVTHQLVKINFAHEMNDNTSFETFYSVQQNHRREYDRRRVQSDNTPMADIKLITQQVESIAKSKNFQVGLSASLQVNNNIAGTGTTPIIPNFDNHTFAIFGSHNVRVKNHLIDYGIRYDYKYFDAAGYRYDYDKQNNDGSIHQVLMTDQKQYHNLSGMLGLSSTLSNKITWKNNIGLAWRAPSANELYADGIHHGTGTYEVGDIKLKSEKGYKYISTLEFRNKIFQISVDAYGQYINDYIYSQPNPDSVRQTIRGTFPLFQYEQTDALFYGFDANLHVNIDKNIIYQGIISTVRAKNIKDDTYLPFIPADRLLQSIVYHTNENKNNYVKLKHTYTARQNRYEVNSDFTSPPPSYHLFDLIASYSIFSKTNQSVNIMLSIENLFNTSYKDYMDRFRYYTHANGKNTSLKINYTF